MERGERRGADAWLVMAIGAISVVGLTLRIAGANGGLWSDEAWSAVYIREAGTPLGVLLDINHDNNHHLNSLWMWLVGIDAPPLALRALSIVAGTLTILVAALIGSRQSWQRAVTAALLFAISPILVDYGSQARGYAPMLLAAMCGVAIVGRCLDRGTVGRGSSIALAVATALGLFSQLTLVFFLAGLIAWAFLTTRAHSSLKDTAPFVARLFGPAVATAVIVVAALAGTAYFSPAGFRIGGYEPFSLRLYRLGLSEMIDATVGISGAPGVVVFAAGLIALTLVLWALVRGERERWLYVVALVAFPLVFPLFQVGNSGFARYYLLCSVGMLLLASTFIARGLDRGGRAKAVSLAGLVSITVTCLWGVWRDVSLARGDTDAAVIAMASILPDGASVAIDHPSHRATLEISALRRRYPLRIDQSCANAQFFYTGFVDTVPPPQEARFCGKMYKKLVERRRGALSGMNWALYRLARRHPSAADRPVGESTAAAGMR